MSRSEAGCQCKHYCINCICWLKQPKNSLVSIAGFIIQYWNATISVRWMSQQIKHKSICKERLTAVIRQAAQLHKTVHFTDTACSCIPELHFSFQFFFFLQTLQPRLRKHMHCHLCAQERCTCNLTTVSTLLFKLSLLIEQFAASLLRILEALLDLVERKSLQPNRGTQCWWISPTWTRRSACLSVSIEIISAIPGEVSSSRLPKWMVHPNWSLPHTKPPAAHCLKADVIHPRRSTWHYPLISSHLQRGAHTCS